MPTKNLAIFADPVFDLADSRITNKWPSNQVPASAMASVFSSTLERAAMDTNLINEAGSALPRLPFTLDEARGIQSVVKEGESYSGLGFDASIANAESAHLEQYQVVHFATHALLDDKHPEFSGLVLSLYGKNGEPVNGYLKLEDIYKLRLPAELVVLSACQTALGMDTPGEGLIGLTRGFMSAGAKRVVASLWRVDDFGTAELMKHFYRAMFVDKQSPAAALRTAQLAMRRSKAWRDPYYWAGFIIQGEWR